MSEHESETSPWASPDSEVHIPPSAGATHDARRAHGPPAPASPGAGHGQPAGAAGFVVGLGDQAGGPRRDTGADPRVSPETAAKPPAGLFSGGSRPSALTLFGWAAGLVLVIGLVIVLVISLSGGSVGSGGGLGEWGDDEAASDPNAPKLARLCPPPSNAKPPEYAEPPPPPPGERTVDEKAGISYAAYGDPWQPWTDDWSGGDLNVRYRIGQHFVTEVYPGGEYHASILSGSVPATVNDGMALDLKCTGKQVSSDVRVSYYPTPHRLQRIRDERTKLGGRPAWVSVFRLRFDEPGLKAKSELVGVALIDVGKPEAAVLYVSIPGTHSEHDRVVDDVIKSVRMLP